MSALAFHFDRGGIHLPALDLWLDPPRSRPGRVFVSHAHSDHIAAHQEVILTAPTARFVQARLGRRRVEHVLSFGQPTGFETGDLRWQITLLPAGHILGSAMALIEAAGESLLYTGDFKLRAGLTAEPCEPRPADLLIMETTFGQPRYRFPATREVLHEVQRFCHEAIQDGVTPVLLGYSLGKSQEVLRGLAEAGLPILLHPQVHRLTRIYEQLGCRFPVYGELRSRPPGGHVVICPPHPRAVIELRELCPVRTALLSGWAVDPRARFRARADAAFPLSDHADFPELLEFVRRVRAKRVFTLHGFAADFAGTLREAGWDARALSEPEQLTLALGASGAPTDGEARRIL
jgi:DNA ligase-1